MQTAKRSTNWGIVYGDLTIIIMITVNALILNQSIEANEVLTVEDLDFHSRRILTGRPDKNFLSENRKNKRFKHRLHRNSYVDPIIIKLNNVIDKYEVRRGDLEELYMGVVGCGLSRCEKFKNLIPENQRLRRLHCFKKQNGFKRMVTDLLRTFYNGIQRVDKSFQSVINFEKWPHLSNRSRQRILEEFKLDVKTLNVEIETALASKRLNKDKELKVPVLPRFQRPENQTHLMIYEWRIIQASKKFLRDWQRNLYKVSRCWKRRRQRKRERQLLTGSLDPNMEQNNLIK
ncbi:hypothetical protein RUM44_001310 [Polyplax serrata]|uniref:Uncharacterized protein n=1 Tax=Polyplax serrata TaxID=468196 RepID=A0ABR1AJP9_POLSC